MYMIRFVCSMHWHSHMCRYAVFEAGKQKHKNAQNRCFTQFSQNFKSIELPHKMFETSSNFNTDHFLYKGNFLGGETMTIQNFENKHHPTYQAWHWYGNTNNRNCITDCHHSLIQVLKNLAVTQNLKVSFNCKTLTLRLRFGNCFLSKFKCWYNIVLVQCSDKLLLQ